MIKNVILTMIIGNLVYGSDGDTANIDYTFIKYNYEFDGDS